jgi:hypothetical protein
VCVRKYKQVNNQKTKKGRKNLLQSFIVEHYLNKAIDVYCGGPEIFGGTVEACDDTVLTIKNKDKNTYVVIDKIIALWLQ